MKRLIIPFIALSIFGCNQIKPQSKYIVKLNQDPLDDTNANLVQKVKVDTIKANNDASGYYAAAKAFIAARMADSIMAGRGVSKTRSFEVYDSNGKDLKAKLPQKQIDSVNNIFKRLGHPL